VSGIRRRDFVILLGGSAAAAWPPVARAQQAGKLPTVTTTVPIVFVTGGDPVRVGLVASLNRPGGNVTGISFITAELGSKQLGLLRELKMARGQSAFKQTDVTPALRAASVRSGHKS
jgi:hypothetical protein